jgi:hypothetical protein
MIDYRHAAIDTLTEFAQDFPNMTLGEILYSSFRGKVLGKNIEKVSDLTEINDKAFYEAIEKAKEDEYGK